MGTIHPQVVNCHSPFYFWRANNKDIYFACGWSWSSRTHRLIDRTPGYVLWVPWETPQTVWPLPHTVFWVSSSIEDICLSGLLFQESSFPSGRYAPNLGCFSAFCPGVINHEMCLRSFNIGWQRCFGNLSPWDSGFN